MNFWIFQDKPNKRITIHRAECGTRNGRQPSLSEGRSWHGPYPNYDEAFGKAKEMSPRKGAQILPSAILAQTVGRGGDRGPQLRRPACKPGGAGGHQRSR
jgi:hypothetical protein